MSKNCTENFPELHPFNPRKIKVHGCMGDLNALPINTSHGFILTTKTHKIGT